MKVYNEQDILDIKTRKKIINDIGMPENKARKQKAFKAYQVYKDRTNVFVIDKMLQLFDADTVREMSYSISNLSILRKIIDKLARVYSLGADRDVVNDQGEEIDADGEKLEKLAKLLNANSQMKKLNRLFKLEKNMAHYIKPTKIIDGEQELYTIKLQPTPPYLYDVVEDANDYEKPMCYIFSHFKPEFNQNLIAPLTNDNIKSHQVTSSNPFGNNKDELIADSPDDKDADLDQFIWWTKNYHFTTDCHGEIISGENILNPIGEIPILNFALDQDGEFWAEGGDDLVDGAILVNSMLSHTMHIGVTQGYGQFYATGKNLPTTVKLGPNKGIKIEVESKEDPIPQLGFLSANPPLSELKNLVEMYVALILTTNNLSTSGVAVQLGTSQNPSSGVALMIDKSESMEDVHDQGQIFKDQEPNMWRIVFKWMNLYSKTNQLVPELADLILPEDTKVKVSFPDPKPIFSEKEKLENLVIRKDLGINTELDLIKMDEPDLTDSEALAKLKEITAAKMQKMAQAVVQQGVNQPSVDKIDTLAQRSAPLMPGVMPGDTNMEMNDNGDEGS